MSVFDFELPARPYPGLRPFAKDEWPIFFGRERMIDDVIERLIGQCLLVVHGDSGCGKSSLIRAGVLPRLEQQFARGGAVWLTCSVTPGEDPLDNLATALAELTVDGGADPGSRAAARHEIRRVVNSAAHGAVALAQYIAARRSEHVCILVDQFEELFAHARHHGRQQATIFIGLLIGLHKLADPRLRVVLTMRSEFLGACAQYDGFAQAVNVTQYLLPRMERPDLLRAIQEPAALYDGEIAADLAERLITEAGASQDQLPLIQHALMQLHRDCGAKPGQQWRLEVSNFPNGGLRRLLSDHADEVMNSLAPQAETAPVIERMFRALTEINADHQAIRRPQTLAALIRVTGADEATLRRIVDAFRAEGTSLLRPYGDGPVTLDDLIDISHEALIRCWKKIADEKAGWLAGEFNDGIIWSSLLVQCESFEKDPRNVLSATTTEERRGWLGAHNEAWAKRYGGGWEPVQKLMDASVIAREQQKKAEAKARRFKLVSWGLGGVATLLLVVFGSMMDARKERDVAREATRKEREARLAAQIEREEAWRKQLQAEEAQETLVRERDAALEFKSTVETELAAIKAAAFKAPKNSEIYQAVTTANTAIQQQVEEYTDASRDRARIYIHIAEESQRAGAEVLKARLESPTRMTITEIVVPGIQLVSNPPKESILRCFDVIECKDPGQHLLSVVNHRLEYPKVELRNFSRLVSTKVAPKKAASIRPLHFELYFARGDLIPEGSKAAAQ